MQLWGPQRFILQAVQDRQGQSTAFIGDAEVAAQAKMDLGDLRNGLLTLERDGFLSLARTTEGYTASLEAKGRLALSAPLPTPSPAPRVEGEKAPTAVKVRPKGLQSFDAEDADFFPQLLPGPRGRGGLPQSIDYWKSRIEERDADRTFRVGVIYGPSGCGKSSLVKAGLLPRLGSDIRVVFVEAVPQETEARLFHRLRKQCPELPNDLGLSEALAALIQQPARSSGEKVLLVLDQFEQWLSAKRGEEDPELVRALRHCDGERLQAIVLVRVDFWMALTRFMTMLGIELRQGQNFAAVDLFDLRHATKVLTAFGQAFGALPDELGEATPEQEFVRQAVAELEEGERIAPVRLALFAEMVKGKDWVPETLRAVGGAQGVGVAFLEETFHSPQANPRHRLHEQAAQSVLRALLPEGGADIKGRTRSYQQLAASSGYGSRARDFEELLRTLDSELRLITPTEPEGADGPAGPAPAGGLYFQLTHDYLVPSLREWLTSKQKETLRGRAELCLADRSVVWNGQPEDRHLPAWWEWLLIRLFTRKKDWTAAQRPMMRRANVYYYERTVPLFLLLTFGACTFAFIPFVLPVLLLYPLLLTPAFLTDPRLPLTVTREKRVLVCAVALFIYSTYLGGAAALLPLSARLNPEEHSPEFRRNLPFTVTFSVCGSLLFLLMGTGLLRFRRWAWLLTVCPCGLVILACCALPVVAFFVSEPLEFLVLVALNCYILGLPSGLILYTLLRAKHLFWGGPPPRAA